MPPDEVWLRHMLDAARKVITFSHGRSRTDLESDEQLALAIVRLLEIVGEAAKQVSAGSRTAHPEIPWREIAGTRDRLIHGYFDVDLDVVWSIVTRDMPGLVASVESILRPNP
ncbi:MAG: DUF86 domain-containing protein [Gemmatimonadetes bacterium]|nr:DUF86 domain-containing protein [Gemmatimonadota bacterium]